MRLEASPEEEEAEGDLEESRARIRTSRLAGRATPRGSYRSREEDLTAQINDEILETSLVELQNLRDIAESGVTTQGISARKTILKTLSQLQKFRKEILGIYEGSVVFLVYCPTVEALEDLWVMCESGKLSAMFHKAFVTKSFLRRHRVKRISISVSMPYADYLDCRKYLLQQGEWSYDQASVVGLSE